MASSAREWTAPRRRPRTALVSLGIAVASVSVAFRTPLWTWLVKHVLPRYREVERGVAQGVTFLYEEDRWNDLDPNTWYGPGRLVARFADGSTTILAANPYAVVGTPSAPRKHVPSIEGAGFGMDVTGDGTADVVLQLPSGGSGGRTKSVVFSFIVGQNTAVALEPAAIIENAWLDDVDRDGNYEFVGFDSTFAYVWTSGAGSTRPRIVARLADDGSGTWKLDHRLMRDAGPDEATLSTLRQQIRAASLTPREAWLAPLLRGTIGLIYAGRPDDARAFLQREWRGTNEERDTFEREFDAQCAKSPWWAEIRNLAIDGEGISKSKS